MYSFCLDNRTDMLQLFSRKQFVVLFLFSSPTSNCLMFCSFPLFLLLYLFWAMPSCQNTNMFIHKKMSTGGNVKSWSIYCFLHQLLFLLSSIITGMYHYHIGIFAEWTNSPSLSRMVAPERSKMPVAQSFDELS